MKIVRAISTGALIWALIFVEWSIMVFAPMLKDMENLQWAISYILLIPIVIFGASLYYKSGDKVNGFILGSVMLATGLILDAIITVPFFIEPQGGSYTSFFLTATAITGYAELILIAGVYWTKKVK